MNKLIDTIAAYWNARPCNIRHSTAEIGTKEYFDQVEKRRYFVEPHGYKFADFDKWKGRRVLEIGCGIGTDAVNFARAGAFYTGVDLSEESIKLCKKRFDVYGLKGRILQCNAEDLNSYFKNESFDLIYSFGVIHHTPNPIRVIDDCYSLMHPHSELRVMLYAKNSWKNIMIDSGLDQPEAQSGCPLATTYTIDEVRNLFKNFKKVDIEQDFIFPWIIENYVNYEYILQPWFASMPQDMFKALEKKLGWHLLIKAKM